MMSQCGPVKTWRESFLYLFTVYSRVGYGAAVYRRCRGGALRWMGGRTEQDRGRAGPGRSGKEGGGPVVGSPARTTTDVLAKARELSVKDSQRGMQSWVSYFFETKTF